MGRAVTIPATCQSQKNLYISAYMIVLADNVLSFNESVFLDNFIKYQVCGNVGKTSSFVERV